MRRLLAPLLLLAAAPAAARAQFSYAQSFTAPGTPDTGAPNTVLRQLSVPRGDLFGLGAPGGGDPFVAKIYAFDGTRLVGPALFSQILGQSFSGLALTPNLALTPGGQYAVAVDSAGLTLIYYGEGDIFAGGRLLRCDAARACAPVSGDGDISIAVRFGPATTVPEPGTFALAAGGATLLGAWARRRRAHLR